ncbi:MAG TPA: MXAN_5187 C-terminal domain-containing protein [Polyangiaceae bacterium]
MEQAELDVALEELELRLERLRALYEQYFLGLEKIEPQVARKDVDRRIYVLRREKIRNTAKRFKLQTIIQRYNTFQQYWMRICREIENGTYKRHLLRAQKNSGELLTIAARRRLGRQARLAEAPADPNEAQAPPAPEVAPAPVPDVAPVPVPAPAIPPAAAVPSARPPGSAPLPPRLIPAAAIAAAAPSSAPAPKPASSLAPKPASSLAPKPASKLESLDLDMDFMGDWDPSASRAPARPASPPAKPLGATRVAPAAQAPPPKPAPPAPAAPAPPAPAPTAAAARPGSIHPRPVTVPPRPVASSPPRPGIPVRAAPPPKPVPSAARPAPAAPLAPSKPLGSAPLARPAAAQSLRPAAPAAAAAGSSVDDQRMRDLHARLQQAKQQTKEANVSYEGLAKSIRAAEAKLREQHKNRRIDFDVVIKDGKAVVKPIVR